MVQPGCYYRANTSWLCRTQTLFYLFLPRKAFLQIDEPRIHLSPDSLLFEEASIQLCQDRKNSGRFVFN